MNFATLTLLGWTVLSAGLVSASDRRDGDFWMTLSNSQKHSYIIGFLDGAEESALRDDDIDLIVVEEQLKTANGGYTLLQGAQAAAHARLAAIQLLGNINVQRFADGLNAFYADYRNRLVSVSHAVGLIAASIKGTPGFKLEEESMYYRKIDSGSP